MKFSIKYLLLGFIIIIFLFTRLYKIEEIPPSVYWDEASIGYNAYSILQTGKDEWGEVFPLHFRAFGEFKLPVYIYATVVSVNFFGLNEFSVRLPSVLFSLGVVILTYLLGKKLFGNSAVGLLGSYFLAISPWFFIFSRTGYEATAGLFFYLLGVFFSLQKLNGKLLLLSVVSFILSAYSYNSFRIVSPLTILFLTTLKVADIKTLLKKDYIFVVLTIVLLILSFVPIYRLYKFDSGGSRLAVVSAPVGDFMKNYLSHFNPGFLFFSGDKNLRSQQAGSGQLHLVDLVFLPLGLFFIVRSKSKMALLPAVLLLLGSIPATLTKESPHALRSISMAPFFAIISSYGVLVLPTVFRKIQSPLYITVFFIYTAFFFNYFMNFINIYPSESSLDWQLSYKNIYTGYGSEFDKYSRIIISDLYAQPYIFALFYLKYDPDKFRREVERNSVSDWGYSTVKKFGKFEFRKSSELIILKQ